MWRGAAVLIGVLVLASPASAAVTIRTSEREPLYPKSITVRGNAGDHRGQVALELDEFPYDSYSESRVANTDSKGDYAFTKWVLNKNSRIRVRAGSTYSKVVTVYVHPGVKFKYRTTSGGAKVRVSFTYVGHPGFAPPKKAFYLYIETNQRGQSRRVRRMTGPRAMKQVRDGWWRFAKTFDLPSSPTEYRYFVYACTRGLTKAGYGRSYLIDKRCGERVFRY